MSPINKPFDRLAKEMGDEAPLLLLRALGLFPEDADISIRPLRPETAPPIRIVDLVAGLTAVGRPEFLFHVEFCISLDAGVLETIACYGGSLATQYRTMDVHSVLVLLDRRRGAANPTGGEFARYRTRIQHGFDTVRMWELDPRPILDSGDLRFLAWAVVMASTEEQVLSVAGRIRESRDEEAAARFLTLGSLRYDREVLERMLGGAHMGLMEAILEGSSLVHDLVDRKTAAARSQALGEGREEGLEKGREEGRRELLRAALRERFPGLELDPAIDAFSTPEAVNRVLAATFTCSDRHELQRLLREAAQSSH